MFLTSTIGVATLPSGVSDVQVDVGIDAQAAFLHVAVGDAQVGEQQLQLGEIRLGLGGERMSGWLTISNSGVPVRFRSMRLSALPATSSCMLLPASSSRWARMMPILLRLEAAFGIADLQPAVVLTTADRTG